MQKQLDTPSPYYEGFYTNIKGKIINFYYFCNNQKVTKIIFNLFSVFDGQQKRKRPYIYTRQLYFFDWKMYGPKKKENWKTKIESSYRDTFFCFVTLAWYFLLFCILQKLNICIFCKEAKPDKLVVVELFYILHLMIWTKLQKTLRRSVPK